MKFPLDESLSFLIYRVSTRVSASMRNSFLKEGFDLTPEQWVILARLQEHAGMSQSQLGEKTLKDRHNINRLINTLEKRSYIERRPDKGDKRAYQLFLTKCGATILRKSTPIFLRHYEGRFSGFTADEIDNLRGMLRKIIKNIEAIDAGHEIPDEIHKRKNTVKKSGKTKKR